MNMIYQPKKIAILRDNQHNLKSTRNQQCVCAVKRVNNIGIQSQNGG